MESANQISLPTETIVVCHSGPILGTICVPGSKSVTNRALLLVALSNDTCRLSGVLRADDTRVMLESLSTLGVPFAWEDDDATLCMTGTGGKICPPADGSPLYLGNAGTAARFLTMTAALAPADACIHLTGCERMTERPIADLVAYMAVNGCTVCGENRDCFPLTVHGGGLAGGSMSLPATVSSQFVSAVLLTAPYAREPLELQLEGKVVSQQYIDLTIDLMRQFGVPVKRGAAADGLQNHYSVGRGPYRAPECFEIEADATSATYPLAMAAISGGCVTVQNLGSSSLQGDARFCDLLHQMGCAVFQTKTATTVIGMPPGQRLRAVDVDMSSMTDAFMTAAVLGAVARGTTRLTHIANQRVKECDRLAAMVSQLGRCGITARELSDGIEVDGARDPAALRGASVACYNDHRIAMSFGVLGCAVPDVIITDKMCVSKTYPEFWLDVYKYLSVRCASVCR